MKVNKSKITQTLGSGDKGTDHWLMQKMTAIALAPMIIFFIYKLSLFCATGYQGCIEGFASPWMASYTLTLFSIIFYHSYLGLQVIIEDYVHCFSIKLILLTLVKILSFGATITIAMLLINISITHSKF